MKNYYLMHMDDKIAMTTEADIVKVYKENMLPPYLKRLPNISRWLTSRAADNTRSSVRIIK
jgi:hypothetical protein